jgi:hypothetical protein
MKTLAPALALTLSAALAGCPRGGPADGTGARAVGDGLAVELHAEPNVVLPGERLHVVLTAENVSPRPLRIQAPSGSPYFLRLWRHTGVDWEHLKRYPQADVQMLTPWTLPAGASRRFDVSLPVEPDWPRGEALRLTGEVNGREDVRAALTIRVLPERRAGR